MAKKNHLEAKTLNLIVESMQRFKLEIDTACLANGVLPSQLNDVKQELAKMGITVTRNIEKLEKRSLAKKLGDVCGNEKEIDAMLNFIHDTSSKKLLVIGKENSGKTITLDEAFNRADVYHEEVSDLKDFLEKQIYMVNRLMPIIFIIDISGQEENAFKLKNFKKMLASSNVSKIILVCREIDEKSVIKFDIRVDIKSPGFTDTFEFLSEKRPELLEDIDKEKALKIFDENGCSFFNFTKALVSKDYAPDIATSDFDMAIHLCTSIYKEQDRSLVRSELEKHVKATEKDKTDSMFKVIPYFNFLEHYVVENTYNYLNTDAKPFYEVTLMLDRMHKNRFYVDIDDIVDYLANGIPVVESSKPVLLPYIHEYLLYKDKKKKGTIKKKKQEESEE